MVQGENREPIICPKCKKAENIGSSIGIGSIGAFGRNPNWGEYKCFNERCGHSWKERDVAGYTQYTEFDPR